MSLDLDDATIQKLALFIADWLNDESNQVHDQDALIDAAHKEFPSISKEAIATILMIMFQGGEGEEGDDDFGFPWGGEGEGFPFGMWGGEGEDAFDFQM